MAVTGLLIPINIFLSSISLVLIRILQFFSKEFEITATSFLKVMFLVIPDENLKHTLKISLLCFSGLNLTDKTSKKVFIEI